MVWSGLSETISHAEDCLSHSINKYSLWTILFNYPQFMSCKYINCVKNLKWCNLFKLTGDVKNLKVGTLKEGFTYCQPEICNIVKSAIAKLSELGAAVEEVSIPEHYHGENSFSISGDWQNWSCLYYIIIVKHFNTNTLFHEFIIYRHLISLFAK